jgi:hypothetical protein
MRRKSMRGDRNLTRYFLLISFIILIIFALFGTITLDSREELIADQYKQTYTFNYTFKIEIECAPGIYKLSITSTSTQRKEPLIEKKVIGRSIYQISPFLLYILTIFLAVLFSVLDLSNYFLGKNSRYSTANISFTFFWILQFLFKLGKTDLDENELNQEIEIRQAAKNPSDDAQDKIKELELVKSKNLKPSEYPKFADGVILTIELSRKCYEKTLAFKPSYLYYPIEFVCNIFIKKIYVPRSIQILERFPSLEYKDNDGNTNVKEKIEENIKSATEMIAFDSTYPSILLATILSIISSLGISIINVTLSFLLIKLLIVFYLVLNIIIVICTLLYMGGRLKWLRGQ